jgi:putative sterol carrier protein
MGIVDGQDATSLHEQRVRRASAVFATLSERYRGAPQGFDATFQIRLGDVGRTWEVRLRGDRCEVQRSARREPDVVIGTDASTWLALREGRMSGLDAFSQRRLYARGDLDLALGFEGMFELPGGRDPLLRITDVEVGRTRIKTLIAGGGPTQVVCVHGLGANKTSFFETAAAPCTPWTCRGLGRPTSRRWAPTTRPGSPTACSATSTRMGSSRPI